jgi:hypothetical protein
MWHQPAENNRKASAELSAKYRRFHGIENGEKKAMKKKRLNGEKAYPP